MLAELMSVHAELRDQIAALAALASQPHPDMTLVSAARLRLTRLSRRRYSLIQCTIVPSLHDLASDDARALSDLCLEAAAQAVQSAEHICRWTIGAIEAEWPAYQRASTQM